MNGTADDLSALMGEIESLIQRAVMLKLSMTTQLLRIVRLDLITLIHQVGEGELGTFAESLAALAQPADQARSETKPKSRKTRRNCARPQRLF